MYNESLVLDEKLVMGLQLMEVSFFWKLLWAYCFSNPLHLLMANLLSYDPSSHLSRVFYKYPSTCSSEVNRNFRFTLKGCFDASNGNGNRVLKKEKTKGVSVIHDGCHASVLNVEHRSPGGSHNKPFCFTDHQFPQKLVVAVDVDEGMYDDIS